MTEITKHFANAIFIVHKNKVLLHKHKKLNLILPVGGHVDRDELPDESAIRETKEETGLDVELYTSKKLNEWGTTREINMGEHMNIHKINEFHEHICFVYYAKSNSDEINPAKGESKETQWYSKEEIEDSTYLKEDIKDYALEALEILKE